MRELRGKVAVVTGAGGAIGFAIAKQLASEGMKVVLADVNEPLLDAKNNELSTGGATTCAIPCDVSKLADVDALCEKTVATFGAVHVVCNNAGIVGDRGCSWKVGSAAWERAISVNVLGVVHGIEVFTPVLLRQNCEAHIVNTASPAGFFTSPFFSVYHATKAAVVSLTESLSYELQFHGAPIGVSLLCPGHVESALVKRDGVGEHLSEAERAYLEMASQKYAWMGANEVAIALVNAIRSGTFYVFPEAKFMLERLRLRVENILQQKDPDVFRY